MTTLTNHNAQNSINTDWLKSEYFDHKGQCLKLSKGDVLIEQGEKNDKLFLVTKGDLSGFYKPEDESAFQVFIAHPNMFIGLYSFFCKQGQSYATVKAEQAVELTYLTREQIPNEGDTAYNQFISHMMPVIVNEIYLRQMLLLKNATEKESAVKQLMQADKLATLGQLAAGLAHELNNAIGVISSRTEWVSTRLTEYYSQKDSRGLSHFFEKAMKYGQQLNSQQIREKKEKIIEELQVKEQVAKRLAKMDLNKSELEFIAKNKENDFIPTLHKYWDTGLALHDMKLAADHTTHVIRSIKDLGGKSKGALKSCDIQSTITKSLALLKQVLKDINIKLEMDYDLSIHAIEGDLIQVWINLIKNAAESLTHAKTIDPKIKIQSSLKNNKIEIRITDNGPGIQKEVLPQIFQPSFSTKVTGLSFGLGLGLSIIEKIITSYSGQIKVHSKEGKTTFIVLFPNK